MPSCPQLELVDTTMAIESLAPMINQVSEQPRPKIDEWLQNFADTLDLGKRRDVISDSDERP